MKFGYTRAMLRLIISFAILVISAPALARDSLGVFGQWGAFRDADVPRCYAIAAAEGGAGLDFVPFASVGTWPERNVRGQVHFRLSRELSSSPRVSLAVGRQRFTLTAGEGDAWATDIRADRDIVSAMRAASRMSISATDARGNRFTDRYSLDGAATAIDAASVGCNSRN